MREARRDHDRRNNKFYEGIFGAVMIIKTLFCENCDATAKIELNDGEDFYRIARMYGWKFRGRRMECPACREGGPLSLKTYAALTLHDKSAGQ
jgi:hypothetical protein